MKKEEYYLSSLDSYKFQQSRRFEIIKLISISSESALKDAWIVKINPNLIGQDFGLGNEDIDYLVLTARHKGVKINNIKEFPCFVYIMRIKDNRIPLEDVLESKVIEVIAWGEIYLKYIKG